MRCVWLALAVVVYCAGFPLYAEPLMRAHGFPGCCAEIRVVYRGVPAMGRIVITPDGAIFLEHIPEAHARWAVRTLAAVVRPEKKPTTGDWDSRGTWVSLYCCRWQRVGAFYLPASVVVDADAAECGAGSIFVSRHRLLESREQFAVR